MVKDKEIQQNNEQSVQRQESHQANQPNWVSEAHAREKQYAWKSPNKQENAWEKYARLSIKDQPTELLVQEVNRRIQKGDIRLLYGTDANDREIVVYQVKNRTSKNNFETWEWPNIEFVKGEKVHAEDLRLFRHVFDEQEAKDIGRAKKSRNEKKEEK